MAKTAQQSGATAKSDARKSSRKSAKSLRELLDEFEQIVQWFDGEDLDVEAATEKFAAGAKLADEIREKLANEKNKIEIVKRKFDVAGDENSAPDDENPATSGDDFAAENDDLTSDNSDDRWR